MLMGFLKRNRGDGRGVSLGRTVVLLVFGVAVFSLGLGIGQGRIEFGRDAALQRSVQDGKLPEDLNYSSVEDVYDALKKNYDGDLDEQALLDGIKQGLANASGDNYTEYLNGEAAKEFNEELDGTFTGIGAELGKDEQALVIIAPIDGFPAAKAGLRPQDIIAEIDGESAFDLSITEAVKKIRGPENTKVSLKIIRGTEQLDVEITRAMINIPSVESEILDGNIGYLKVSRFSDDTAQLARAAAQKFKKAKVQGVILDVRNDPGGLLDASVDVASLWLSSDKVVLQEKRNDVVVRTYNAQGESPLKGVPTVVLVNEGSASASEIVAGALQDNGAATLIGMQTFGKGSVQQLVNLSGDGVLKVTIARWYTPDGKNIDKEGIAPDKKVERTDEDYKANRDPQKQAAIDFLKK